MTVWQLHELSYRASRSNLTNVGFFAFDYGGWVDDNWAQVRGTATLLDDRIAYPINHVWIDCDRSAKTCSYRQIAMMLPGRDSFAQIYNAMELADDTYRVTRWENQQIDAVPVNQSSCRINQLSLNFATNEFFEIARNNSSGDCETTLGTTLPRLERPRISQIVDGREIISKEFEAINDEAYGYVASDFRSKVERLINEASDQRE